MADQGEQRSGVDLGTQSGLGGHGAGGDAGDRGDLLLIDDEESVLLTMQAILAGAGHRAEAAGTRDEALAMLDRGPFDVVVSDLHLDEGDGLQVIAEAKRRWPATTGIVLTGYGTFDAVTRALRAGVDDFLVKPTDVEELKRSIARCVRKSRAARQLAARAREVEVARRAEAALRESEARFRLLADAAPVMIWAAGPDRQRTFSSRRWLEFTGRSVEETLGLGWAEDVHPEDRAWCLAVYTESFDARQAFRMEYRLRRAGGAEWRDQSAERAESAGPGQRDDEYRWVEDDGAPHSTPDGAFAGFIGACSDVTERKRAALEREAQLARERTARVEAEFEAELARAEVEAAEAALKTGGARSRPLVPPLQSPPSPPPTPAPPKRPVQAPPRPRTSAVGLTGKPRRPSREFPRPPSSVPGQD